jgi:phage I-like protein
MTKKPMTKEFQKSKGRSGASYFAPGRFGALLGPRKCQDAPQANRDVSRRRLIGLSNEAEAVAEEGLRIVGLANAFAATADDWVQLTPPGEHPHGPYIQRVNSATMRRVIANFKAEAAKMGASFAGKPFYIGHPDVPHLANQYPDKKAYGWIMDLDERADGLYGRVKWSEPGRLLIANAHYKFLSLYWGLEEVRERGRLYADPAELVSVGLTNNPNIKGLKPLANEKDPMKTKVAALAALLMLANDAAEADVMAAAETEITTLRGDKTKLANEKQGLETKLQTETQTHATAKTNLANVTTERDAAAGNFKKERAARIPLMLDNALLSGRISIAERAGYETKLANEATFDAAVAEIANKPANVHTQSQTKDLGNRKVALANEHDRSQRVQELVSEKRAAGLTYDKAFAAVQRENPELFAAMTKPQGN